MQNDTLTEIITLDAKSWSAGYAAGLAGRPGWPVPKGYDGLSWTSAYIEGEADRLRPERLENQRVVKP